MMRRLAFFVVLALVVPTCAAAAQATAGLPPLPTTAPTSIGPIPIQRVHDLTCRGKPATGCFDSDRWVIEVADSIPLPIAWVATYHELAHATLYLNGFVFDDPKAEDTIAEVMAQRQLLELRAGWPRGAAPPPSPAVSRSP